MPECIFEPVGNVKVTTTELLHTIVFVGICAVVNNWDEVKAVDALWYLYSWLVTIKPILVRTLIEATPITHLKEHAILGIEFHNVDAVTPIA